MASAAEPASVNLAMGGYIDLLNPSPEDIRIIDIGIGLTNQCRFGGQLSVGFYSVAQHCVIVSRLVPPHLALEGLLHDAPEAYIGDVQAPLKRLLPDYKKIEKGLEKVIGLKYDLHFDYPEVKLADQQAFVYEKRYILNNHDFWPGAPTPEMPSKDYPIEAWHRSQALRIFMKRANELLRERNLKP